MILEHSLRRLEDHSASFKVEVEGTEESMRTAHDGDTRNKASIRFIMNTSPAISHIPVVDYNRPGLDIFPPLNASQQSVEAVEAVERTQGTRSDEKRRARACKIDGCDKYIINRGLCFRHGGGKKCSVADCTSSAKNAGLCWRHGGSVKCLVDGCERRGKSRGLCWAHGGGTKCSDASCSKVAVSNGYCWAHGGGKRCALDGCSRAAYERTHNYCSRHFQQIKRDEAQPASLV